MKRSPPVTGMFTGAAGVISALAVILAAAIPAANPAAATEGPTAILACPAVTDAAARLKCFDQTLPAARPVLEATTQGTKAAQPAAAIPPTVIEQRAAFGGTSFLPKEVQEARKDAGVDQLIAKIVSASRDASGLMVVTLDNGQVWRQLEAPQLLVPRNNPTIRIDRGALPGVYYAVVGSSPKRHSVKRIK